MIKTITWSGTWETSFGTVKLIQNKDNVFGIYTNLGIIEAKAKGNVLTGRFTNKGDEGKFEFTTKGSSFTGKWAWKNEKFKAQNSWSGKKASASIATEVKDGQPVRGEWDSVFGKLHLHQNGDLVFGLYSNLGTISGKLTDPNTFEGQFTNLGKPGVMKLDFNHNAHRFEGIWSWKGLDKPEAGKWTGDKTDRSPVKPPDTPPEIKNTIASSGGTLTLGEIIIHKAEHFSGVPGPDFFDKDTHVEYDPSVWKSETTPEIGISLQGGGLKGAFGVGALHYLAVAKIINPKRRLKISSASTGSITGVVLAENMGTSTTLKTIAQYMDLVHHEDMFVLREDVKKLLNKIPGLKKIILKMIKTGNFTDIDYEKAKDALADEFIDLLRAGHDEGIRDAFDDFPLFGLFGEYVKGFIGGAKEKAADKIDALKKLYNTNLSLAILTPVENKLNAAIQPGAIQRNNSELYMAVISYNTGALCYITQNLTLLHPKESNIYGVNYNYGEYVECVIDKIDDNEVGRIGEENDAVGHKFELAKAALASGAFPAFFAPVKLDYFYNGDHRTHYFFDGGIKENQPIEMLGKTTGVHYMVSIYCSPITRISDHKHIKATKEPKVSEVAFKASDYQGEELARNDSAYGSSVNIPSLGNPTKTPYVVHVAPTVGTLSLTEVHPFNIKATIWYGYMRAYDELYIAQHKDALSPSEISQIRKNSEDIYLYFKVLYMRGYDMVKNNIYRSKKAGTEGTFNNVLWINSVHEKKTETAVLKEGTLKNESEIKMMFFHEDSLANYLDIKFNLVTALINRHKQFKEKDPNTVKEAFMYGEKGFMQKTIYTDWFGVYESLDHVRITLNKRSRLKSKFFNSDIFKDSSPLIIKTGEITSLHTQQADKNGRRFKNNSALTGKVQRIKDRLNQIPGLFEGNENDRLIEGIFVLNNEDDFYTPKDKTYIAKE